MGALIMLSGFAPCRIQRVGRKDLYVKTAWISDNERIRRVFGFLIEKGADRRIDQLRRAERTLRRDTDDGIGSKVLRGSVVTVEHIGFVPAKTRNRQALAFP